MKLQLKYESNLKSEVSDNYVKFKDHCRQFENECSAQYETEKGTEINRFKKEREFIKNERDALQRKFNVSIHWNKQRCISSQLKHSHIYLI